MAVALWKKIVYYILYQACPYKGSRRVKGIMTNFADTRPDARQVLEHYRALNEAPVDVEKICKAEGISIDYVDFSELEKEIDGEQVSGAIYVDESTGKRFILVREDDPTARQRFTIAHELGHYYLHRNDENEVFVSLRQTSLDGLRRPSLDPRERQANNFAAELLMPEELLQKEYALYFFPSISHLSELFKVSKEALRYRLQKLGLFYVEK